MLIRQISYDVMPELEPLPKYEIKVNFSSRKSPGGSVVVVVAAVVVVVVVLDVLDVVRATVMVHFGGFGAQLVPCECRGQALSVASDASTPDVMQALTFMMPSPVSGALITTDAMVLLDLASSVVNVTVQVTVIIPPITAWFLAIGVQTVPVSPLTIAFISIAVRPVRPGLIVIRKSNALGPGPPLHVRVISLFNDN